MFCLSSKRHLQFCTVNDPKVFVMKGVHLQEPDRSPVAFIFSTFSLSLQLHVMHAHTRAWAQAPLNRDSTNVWRAPGHYLVTKLLLLCSSMSNLCTRGSSEQPTFQQTLCLMRKVKSCLLKADLTTLPPRNWLRSVRFVSAQLMVEVLQNHTYKDASNMRKRHFVSCDLKDCYTLSKHWSHVLRQSGWW